MTARKAITVAPEAAGEVRTLALADILMPPEFQIRKRTDPGAVSRYAAALRAGAEFPPVKVGNIGGALVLLDGYHRRAAHEEVGRPTILAEVFPTSPTEARWVAAKANMTHGLQLKPGELREAFRAFVKAGRHRHPRGGLLSLREGAKAFGAISHVTYRVWMRKDFPRIAAQFGAEDPRGGGLPETRMRRPDFTATAEGSLAQAVAAARGVSDPHHRGALVDAFRRALAEVEQGGPFTLPDF